MNIHREGMERWWYTRALVLIHSSALHTTAVYGRWCTMRVHYHTRRRSPIRINGALL